MKMNDYNKALAITAFGVVLMSIESVLIKLTNVPPVTYAFYVGVLFFLSLNSMLLKDGVSHTLTSYKKDFKTILIIGFLMSMANISFIHAIKYTSIANTVIIISASPLFAMLFAFVFYRQAPQKNVLITSLFIFVGLYVIFAHQVSTGNYMGDIFALLCTMSFSLIFVIMSRFTKVNRFAVLAFGGLMVTIVTSLFITSFYLDMYSLMIILIAGLLVSPFSRVFTLIGTKTLPASEVSLLTILETVLAPLWAWLFLNEIPIQSTLTGGLIIISALIINTLYLMRQSKLLSVRIKG